jgi:Protein of unknown function (DUF4238)
MDRTTCPRELAHFPAVPRDAYPSALGMHGTMETLGAHHIIPRFFLKRWANEGGLLEVVDRRELTVTEEDPQEFYALSDFNRMEGETATSTRGSNASSSGLSTATSPR